MRFDRSRYLQTDDCLGKISHTDVEVAEFGDFRKVEAFDVVAAYMSCCLRISAYSSLNRLWNTRVAPRLRIELLSGIKSGIPASKNSSRGIDWQIRLIPSIPTLLFSEFF